MSLDQTFFGTLDWMVQKGVTDVDGNSFYTSIASRALFRTIETCGSGILVVQSLSLDCVPAVIGGRLFKDNAGCAACKTAVRKVMADRRKLEAEAKSKNTQYQIQTIPSDDEAIAAACDQTCYSCRVVDVDQTARIRLSQTCEFDTVKMRQMLFEETSFAFDEQARKLQALLNGATSIEDVCTAPCEADPTKICTNPTQPNCTKLPNHDDTITAITNKLANVMDISVVTRIFTALKVYQGITLASSSSIVAASTVQSFDIKVVQEVVQKQLSNIEFYAPEAITEQVVALEAQNGARANERNDALTAAVEGLKALPKIINDNITMLVIIAVLICMVIAGIYVAKAIATARSGLKSA
jgi:hypothetical protein